MKQRYRIYLAIPFASFIMMVAGSGVALAAPQEITMTPTSASPVIAPGASYAGTFQVINNGQSGYGYNVYSTPYHVSGENYTPRFTTLPNVTDASKWFTFSRDSGQSGPGQTTSVDYSIHVPATTPPGGYYATVFAQTANTGGATSSVVFSERVGEIFYIQVAGPVTQSGEVSSWDVSTLQSAPFTATTRLQNSGGLHYAATVNIVVKDLLGHSKYSYSTTREVLPQTVRQVPATWGKAPMIGFFKVSGDASYLNQHTTLPTKWVLIMSTPIRIVVLALLAFAIATFARGVVIRRAAHTKKHEQRDD